MSKSRMISGTPLLKGDNSIPGVKIHKEVKAVLPKIEAACRKMGLDYYPIIVEYVTYDQMAEIASYGGFPSRFPHWSWGMEYEQMARGYEYNQYRIGELVINTNPCYIYVLDSNTLLLSVNVIAHAIGHNDFFKNNIFFEKTSDNMMNKLANHGTRVRQYMARWGEETVTEFIDHVLRIDMMVDSASAWQQKRARDYAVKDKREYRFPQRIKATNSYMDSFLNSPEFIQHQQREIERQEAAEMLDIFAGGEKDVFRFLRDNAPLKPWQQDIMAMLYEESMYFTPQRQTKMINEGWASYVDFEIMCRQGLAALGQKSEDAGGWEYAHHKMRVLGGKYSQNPYKLGFELFLDIEDRWNKGKFGPEWENCKTMQEKAKWNKNLGLGKEKCFEVRQFNNDYTMIQQYFTPEFCEEKEFFEYRHTPSGEWIVESRDFKKIKKKLLQKYLNNGLPDIRLEDPNHLGRGWFLMQHYFEDKPLEDKQARETMSSIYRIWKNVVVLASCDAHGSEIVYVCRGPNPDKEVIVMPRSQYEKNYI